MNEYEELVVICGPNK